MTECTINARGCTTTPSSPDAQACPTCLQHVHTNLSEILRLATDAAAWTPPTPSGTTSSAYGSKPPMSLDNLDPHNTPVPQFPGQHPAPTVLEILEAAEREIRDHRHLAPYGLVTEATGASLTSTIRFLHHHLDWANTHDAFDLATFNTELRDCTRALRRFDANLDRTRSRYRVPCPTLTDTGECGTPLIVTSHNDVTCRGCHRTWQPTQLLAIAGRDADIWLDAEAISQHLGISERTIRHWGQHGKIAKRGMLYRLSDIQVAT